MNVPASMIYQPIRNSAQLCPDAVHFQRAPAPADLRDWVDEFWQYDVRPGFETVPIQVFPSGCVVIRFDIGPSGIESVLYPPSASPQMKSVFRRGVSAFGAALRIGCATPLLGCVLPELESRRCRLADAWARPLGSLEERLHDAAGFDERVRVLADALREARPSGGHRLEGFAREVEATIGGRELAAGASERTLRRRFEQHVGHSPKQLQRVVRVQRAVRALARTPRSLTDVAHASGFSDQPHLTREFVRLLGMTPGSFRASLGSFHRTDLAIWDGLPWLHDPARGAVRRRRMG